MSLAYPGRGGSSKPVQALSHVSFDVALGESFGIVGETGSGKSTILKAISGLTGFQSGTISLKDRDIKSFNNNELSHYLQLVFQDATGALNPRFTIASILAEPLVIQGRKVEEAVLVEALERIGLEADYLYRFPHQLSGGERQRVAISRALMTAPHLLLLDEPTSALDVGVQAEILNLLMSLKTETGLTYILVSHDLGVIAHMCDRVMVMKGGEKVEELATSSLRARRAINPYTKALIAESRL
ncbi:MAG: ABC transporter ATP-binding protein [Rhodospirillaceae bacterium]|nr:ABC transporter ATP-binding protein [Rhodospirillaceae bacterium]